MIQQILDLYGKTISEIKTIENYFMIKIDDTWITIYNPSDITCQGNISKLDLLKNQILNHIYEIENEKFVFEFSNGINISVNITPEAYTSPEAIVFNFPNHLTVVVN